MTSIAQARQEVQTAFEKALAMVDTAEPQPLAAVEASVWTVLLALGRALVALYLARQAGRPRAARYEVESKSYEICGTASMQVGTLFGRIAFEMPFARRVRWGRLARDLPLLRELGLCGGFSLGVVGR